MPKLNSRIHLGRTGLITLAASLAASVCGQNAYAQSASEPATAQTNDADDGITAGIGDIVVTAQFRGQRLQDTPIAITAMTGAALEARAQQNVTDISGFSPNVNFSPATSDRGSAVSAFIRGIGQADSSFALEPGVGIYLDDVYLGTTFGSRLDLTDIDRVEVLRGPQGTLAGKNSLGGAIKIFSKKPDGTGGGYVDATYGSFHRIDVRGGIDLTLADGLYARVAAVSKHRRGFVTQLDYGCLNPASGIPAQPRTGSGCEIGKEGGQDVTGARLAIRYAPDGGRLEINLIADVSEDSSQPAGNKLTVANNPNVRSYDPDNPAGGIPYDSRFLTGPHEYSNYSNYSDGGNFTALGGNLRSLQPGLSLVPKTTANGWGVSGTIDYELTDYLSIKSITAYREADGIANTDLDLSPIGLELLGNHLSHNQFTQELRLTGKAGKLLDFTVGAFYYDANDRAENRVSIPASFLDFLLDDPSKNKSKSVFAHGELHLTDALNVIGGLRYTKDRKTYSFSRRNPDGSLPSGIPFAPNFGVLALNGQSAVFSGDKLDYRVGVNYRWSPALMTYAQVSTGYKGGGVNPRPFNAEQVQPFGPETLTTYEAGFKGDFLDRVLRINGAVFINKYKDIQLTLQACPTAPCALPANAGDATMKGFELEGVLHPIEGLSIEGAVGFLDFKYTRVNPTTGVQLDFVAPYTNKWQASSSIEYTADLGTSGTLTPRLDWLYQSSFFVSASDAPGSKVNARGLLNGRVSYTTRDRDWTVALGVTNILDKFYYVTKFDNVVGLGVASGILGRPREWSVTVSRKF